MEWLIPPGAEEEEEEGQPFEGTEIPDNEYDLGTSLTLYATLTEKSIFVPPHQRELAELLFDMKVEDS